MTKLLDKAIERARLLPDKAQDDIARAILELAGDEAGPAPLSEDEREALTKSLAQADRGEFATDEEVRAVWRKYSV